MTAARTALRWHVKRVARAVVALGTACLGRLSFGAAATSPRVRVLTYHRFRDEPWDSFSVPPREFERQMTWLKERSLAISLQDFDEFLAGRRAVRRGSVLVTIDDGYSDLQVVLPVLRRLGIPAVAFISAADLQPECAHGSGVSKLTREEIRDLCQSAVEVGSHGWQHRSLGVLASSEVQFEAEESRRALEASTGRPVRAFAYPYGTRRDFTPSTGAILKMAGYSCAFTSQHGSVQAGADRFELPRIKIEGGDGFWLFTLAVRGGLDPWGIIDRFASRFQATPAARLPKRQARALLAVRPSGEESLR